MKVFWSWQNDYAPKTCRHFIRGGLVEAIEAAGEELGLDDAERPEIDHDTKDTAGMTEITATILDKISGAAVFVADVTPIGKTERGKALPNPNVMIELGWALSKLGPERIIAVLNEASGWKPDDLPFDIRHRRALTYTLAEEAEGKARQAAKRDLVRALTGALRANLGEHIETQAATRPIEGVPVKPDNRSIWASAGDKFEHNDSMGRGRRTSVALPNCPRGYIRIVPAGWTNGVPSVNDIARLGDAAAVWPALEGGGSGDFGMCDEGFVRYWMTGKGADGQTESRNVAMFFDGTGEFWLLHGTAVGDHSRGATLRDVSLMRGWKTAMKLAFAVLDRFGAQRARRVEVGLVGMRGVRWHGEWESDSPSARKDGCVIERQRRDWNEEAQLDFLTEANNLMRDLFGLPRSAREDVAKLLAG
jgi:hypothetical protein